MEYKIYKGYKVFVNWDVYNSSWKKLKLLQHSKWYYFYVLKNKWVWKKYYTHRLVALLFLENTLNKPCVNHIDWNKKNNYIDNLEWCTYSDNTKHAYKLWLMKREKWKNSPLYWKIWKNNKNSKKVYQYDLNMNFIKIWDSTMDIQRELWINNSYISMNCLWKKYSVNNFIFKYL